MAKKFRVKGGISPNLGLRKILLGENFDYTHFQLPF